MGNGEDGIDGCGGNTGGGHRTKASCMGVDGQNWTKGSMIWMSRTMLEGPMIHPTCQPVTENVLPADETVRVRSHMPGRRAKCTWPPLPSEPASGPSVCTTYLYTSSDITLSWAMCRTQSGTMPRGAYFSLREVGEKDMHLGKVADDGGDFLHFSLAENLARRIVRAVEDQNLCLWRDFRTGRGQGAICKSDYIRCGGNSY